MRFIRVNNFNQKYFKKTKIQKKKKIGKDVTAAGNEDIY